MTRPSISELIVTSSYGNSDPTDSTSRCNCFTETVVAFTGIGPGSCFACTGGSRVQPVKASITNATAPNRANSIGYSNLPRLKPARQLSQLSADSAFTRYN